MAAGNVFLVALIVLSFLSFLCMVFFNALSATSFEGLYLSSAANVSSRYYLEITPAGWTFSIWSVIYIWNGLWLVYALTTLCRRNQLGYVYFAPRVLPPSFFLIWIFNNLCNIGWLFLWDREFLIPALVFIALIPITCFAMMAISYINCYKHGAWLSVNSPVDLWCTRIMVHNGLATYATWTFIASLINFGLVLKYEGKVDDFIASIIVLCSVLFGFLTWFILETFIFEKYVRYTFTIYPVGIVALFGVLTSKDISQGLSTTGILTAFLLSLTIVFCLVHLILIFICHKRRPVFPKDSLMTLNSTLTLSDQSAPGEKSQMTMMTNGNDKHTHL
ncbi:uncharacterized protein LOC144828906 [Lissotriton helveticus]